MKNYRRTLANQVTFEVVPQDIVNENNRLKRWQYGYQEDYDFVNISMDGTVGEIIEIGGLLIGLPKSPKEVDGKERQPKYQKWSRIEVPNELANFQRLYGDMEYDQQQKKISELFKKYESFITEDLGRCKKGYWFMNDGEPTYLTGDCYMFFQHYFHFEPRRYGDFRMTVRDLYYFWEACFADYRCAGVLEVKSRGLSFSTRLGSTAIKETVLNANSFFPLVSKTNSDSVKLFVQKVREPFKMLPIYLQPESNAYKNEVTALKLEDRRSKEGNSSYIEQYATTVNAYDGIRPRKSGNDEIGKFNAFSVTDYWAVHKDCHTTGIGEVSGKAICGSTAGEYSKGGGKEFKDLYDNSNIFKRNPLGFTESGLYGLFISAEYGQQGFYDEHGWVIWETPEEPIKNELGRIVKMGVVETLNAIEESLKHDEIKLNAQKTKHPRKLQDAFKDAEALDLFNEKNLVAQEYYLADMIKSPIYYNKVFRMNLHWKNGIENGDVEHSASKTGKFQVVWLPDKDDRNSYTQKGGLRKPTLEHIGAFGCDPYYATKVIHGKGSSGALLGLTKSKGDGFPTDTFFLMYLHRPKNEYEFYNDMIMASVYCSMPNLIERNKRGLLVNMSERGFREYAMNRPDQRYRDLKGDDKSIGGWYSENYSITSQENALQSYIERAVGHVEGFDDAKVYFPELIKSWQDYDPSEKNNRTKNDLAVAAMFAIKANEKKVRKVEEVELLEEISLNIFKHSL